jgi:hypothetical protein
MCPGRHIALGTIWGAIAAVLSLYDIGPSLDEDGTLHVPSGEFTTGFLRRVFTSFNLFYFQFPSSFRLHAIDWNPVAIDMSSRLHHEFGSDHSLREPKPFKCAIKPRSVEAEKVIRALGETVSFDTDS